MQTRGDGGGARLGNGLAGGTLSLFSCQRQAQDVPNSAGSPLQCKWTKILWGLKLPWLIGKAGETCLSKRVEAGTEPEEWAVRGKGTSAKFQTGLVCHLRE